MTVAARSGGEREGFLTAAGRELVRLLARDPVRLEGVLQQIRPAG